MNDTSWMARSACRNVSPELFFGPEHEGDFAREMRERSARMVCARCPVAQPCLERAIVTYDRWSFSGGMTPDERDAYRRQEPTATSRAKSEAIIAWGVANRARITEAGEKPCTKCGETKPLDQFNREGQGWRGFCKPCRNAAERGRRAREEMAS